MLERWLGAPARDGNGDGAGDSDGLVDGQRVNSLLALGPGLAGKVVQVFARTTPAVLDELQPVYRRTLDELQRLAG